MPLGDEFFRALIGDPRPLAIVAVEKRHPVRNGGFAGLIWSGDDAETWVCFVFSSVGAARAGGFPLLAGAAIADAEGFERGHQR
jgi:hypothetical protein